MSVIGSKVANISCCDGSAGIAVDPENNVWVTNFYGSSVSLITNAMSSIPNIRTLTGGFDAPNGIAIDGAGTAWITNYHSNNLSIVGKAATGSSAAVVSGNGFGDDAGLREPFVAAIDASGSVWISNAGLYTVTEFIGAAAPVRIPLVGIPQSP